MLKQEAVRLSGSAATVKVSTAVVDAEDVEIMMPRLQENASACEAFAKFFTHVMANQ